MKNLLTVTFILTAAAQSNSAEEQEALRHAALASYKQSGMEVMVDTYVQDKLKRVPDTIKLAVSNTYLLVKTIQDRKVTYTWTF